MKRSSTTDQVSDNEDSSSSDFYTNVHSLGKSFIDLSISSLNLNISEKAKLIVNDDELFKKHSDNSVHIVVDNLDSNPETNINKSKSMMSLSNFDKPEKDRDTQSLNQSLSKNDLKLVSPYGDWCAFSGGSGSGGCIFTGPYEPMIIPKDEFSDESFESTEESDANIDLKGPVGITHNNFQNTEVVWAKRPALPWFPGIIIDPNNIHKEVKDLMKHIGASSPHKDQLDDYSLAVINSRDTDKLFFVFLFNRKKTWLWLPESKLRPFCKENDKFFMENSPLLTTKYKKELEKAYKKAKKFAKPCGPIIPSTTFYQAKHSNDKKN